MAKVMARIRLIVTAATVAAICSSCSSSQSSAVDRTPPASNSRGYRSNGTSNNQKPDTGGLAWNWTRYAADDESFSIEFPFPPSVVTQEVEVVPGVVVTRRCILDGSKAGRFAAFYVDIPSDLATSQECTT